MKVSEAVIAITIMSLFVFFHIPLVFCLGIKPAVQGHRGSKIQDL